MSDQVIGSIVTIATAIIGVAVLAVLVSRQSNTAGVLGAAGSAFSRALGTAVSPITGGGAGGFGLNAGFSGNYGY